MVGEYEEYDLACGWESELGDDSVSSDNSFMLVVSREGLLGKRGLSEEQDTYDWREVRLAANS